MSAIIVLAFIVASVPWRVIEEDEYGCATKESFNGALFLGLWAVQALITIGGIMVARTEKIRRGSWDGTVKRFGIVAIVAASIGTGVLTILAPAISNSGC